MQPSELALNVSVRILHYSDGRTYVALSGSERSDSWSAIGPTYDGDVAGLDEAVEDVSRLLMAWAQVGPLGIAQVLASIRP